MKAVRRTLWKAGLVRGLDEAGVSEFRAKLWRRGVIESSEGYKVWTSISGQSTFYEEPCRLARMHSEWMREAEWDLRLQPSSLHWVARHEDEELTDADREQITARVLAALRWEGTRVYLV